MKMRSMTKTRIKKNHFLWVIAAMRVIAMIMKKRKDS